jgi:molybdenum cofactor biosynthesis enzyme MoaA
MPGNVRARAMTEIISRQEAKAKGLVRYSTGKPCLNGHLSERLVSKATCMECDRIRVKERRKTDPAFRAKEAERVKERRKTDPEYRARDVERTRRYYEANKAEIYERRKRRYLPE